MGTLGSVLREAREAKGLDLREAAQQTRISVNYLKAIESEDFAKLPGEVFVKGFLKNYAKFLGLPEAEVMKRYGDTKVPTPQEQAAAAKAERIRNADQGVGRYETVPQRRTLEPYLWGGVMLFAVVAVLLTVLPGRRSDREHAEPVSSLTPTTAIATGPALTIPRDKLYLEIEAVEDAWVLVRTDASPQKKAVLRKGEVVTWSADDRFLMSYGGIGSVILRLNGRELTVEGPQGTVVRDLTITAAGITAHKAETVPRPIRKPKPDVTTEPTGTSPAAAPQTVRKPKSVATTEPTGTSPAARPQTIPSGTDARPTQGGGQEVTAPVASAPLLPGTIGNSPE